MLAIIIPTRPPGWEMSLYRFGLWACRLIVGRQAGTRGQYIVIDDINGTPYKPASLPCASETWTSLITSHVMRQSIHTPGTHTHTHTHTTAQQSNNTNTDKQPSPSRHNDP